MADKKRILIVDDDPDIRAAMQLILTSHGYEVATADSSKEAFEKIEETPPDLIIMDVMMGAIDEGFQATYRLKGDAVLRKIPVLMITAVSKETGFAFDPAKDESFLPVEGFIEKPVDPEELVNRIRSLIS
jgi:two-component system alkaline phosphatase synthesis response regulator PhoP